MVIGQISLKCTIPEKLDFECVLKTAYAPRTIKRIETKLPISATAVCQEGKIVIPLDNLAAPPEFIKSSFSRGEISLDASSSNLTLYLEDTELEHELTHLGNIAASIDELKELNKTISIKLELK
ncbi:MAG: hypothetical protein INQ03_19270 [Candidatus Heimdallarchaeota archaeon]|nr:hypothetical protein [Candidatus Heimdallarchaeota archaeon]